MWKDMGLYLAWRSNNLCDATPPTKKEIQSTLWQKVKRTFGYDA